MNFNLKSQTLLIILLCSLNQLTAAIVVNCVTVILPEISIDLNFTVDYLNWINLIFLMGLIAFCIPLGKIISQKGIKKYTKIAILTLIISLAISAFTSDIDLFFISRLIQGISIAVLYSTNYSLVVLSMPEESLGRALGIVGSSGYIGMTLAPTISGIITYYFSWRYAFLFMIPLLIIQLVIAHYIKSEWVVDKKPIDYVGIILYIFIIIFLVYGLSCILDDWFIYLSVFTILLIIYLIYERKIDYPVFNLALFKDINYLIGNFASFVAYFVTFIATYVLSLHLQFNSGFDSRIVGLLFLIPPVMMIITAPIAGKASDHHDSRVLSSIAMLFITVTLIIFVYLNYIPFYLLIIALFLQGIGHGLFSSPNNRFVLTSVNQDDLNDATAFLSTSKSIGRMLSIAFFDIICKLIMGDVRMIENIPGLIYANSLIMVLCTVLSVICIILLMLSKFFFKNVENKNTIDVLRDLFFNKIKKLNFS